MLRDPRRLVSAPFDVLIVGGGIHGLAIAYDAARRGLRAALVERSDLGSQSSFNHAKTVHGGLRSLQTGDLRKARESVQERRAMARIAPHLVEPLPFLIGTYRTPTRGRLALRAGFLIDRAIGFDRNRDLLPHLALPAGRVIDRQTCLDRFPGIRDQGLTGGALWYDYQMIEADRLTLAFASAASRHGAALANYVEALGPIVARGRVAGMRARDLLSGESLEIEAALTINAAGAFAGTLAAAFGDPIELPLIKAMNVVTSRPLAQPAIGAPTGDGRLLLAVPWRGRALIGTSHGNRTVPPEAAGVSVAELEAFVDEINDAFPALRLARDEVTLVHRGVVPAARARGGRLVLRPHPAVIDHGRRGVEGAVSVVGVKYTTARAVAERAIDLALAKLGRPAVPCTTAEAVLPGAGIPDRPALAAECDRLAPGGRADEALRERLLRCYGSACRAVLELTAERGLELAPLAPDVPVTAAEVVHAIQHEMACTLSDVVIRRTGLGAAGHPGEAAVEAIARVMVAELGWDAARLASEREALDRFYQPVFTGGLRPAGPPIAVARGGP